jgi:hypothetical protein
MTYPEFIDWRVRILIMGLILLGLYIFLIELKKRQR